MEYVEVNMETQEFLNSEITRSFFLVLSFVDLKKKSQKLKLKRADLVSFTAIMLLFTVLPWRFYNHFNTKDDIMGSVREYVPKPSWLTVQALTCIIITWYFYVLC